MYKCHHRRLKPSKNIELLLAILLIISVCEYDTGNSKELNVFSLDYDISLDTKGFARLFEELEDLDRVVIPQFFSSNTNPKYRAQAILQHNKMRDTRVYNN